MQKTLQTLKFELIPRIYRATGVWQVKFSSNKPQCFLATRSIGFSVEVKLPMCFQFMNSLLFVQNTNVNCLIKTLTEMSNWYLILGMANALDS